MTLKTFEPINRITDEQVARIHAMAIKFDKRQWARVKSELGYGGIRVNQMTQSQADDFESRLGATLDFKRKQWRQRQVWEGIPDEVKDAEPAKDLVLAR